MSLLEIVLLAVSGFFAGVANAVAGGGTFFTFPVMVAFGMTTLEANATSAVAIIPGSLATAAAYWDETRKRLRVVLPFALIAIAGGIIGGLIVVGIGDEGFRPTVPWLLLIATVTFAFSKQIRPLAQKFSGGGSGGIAGYVFAALVAVYGGFFGAGQGIMLLAALAIMGNDDFHKANAIKNIACLLAQGAGIVLFVVNNLVYWPQAGIVAVTAIAGGYFGVVVARRVPENIVRAVVVAIGALLTVFFFIKR